MDVPAACYVFCDCLYLHFVVFPLPTQPIPSTVEIANTPYRAMPISPVPVPNFLPFSRRTVRNSFLTFSVFNYPQTLENTVIVSDE